MTTLDSLRNAIEHAPRDPGPLAPTLHGWRTPDEHYVCARCAGRIMARGCHLPAGTEPIWWNGFAPQDPGKCVTCYPLTKE